MRPGSRIAIAALLPVLFWGPVGAVDLTPEEGEKIERLYRRAIELYQKKEHRRGSEACRELLALLPAGEELDQIRMQANYIAALNYSLLDQADEAVGHLEKAIEYGLTDPDQIDRHPDFEGIRRDRRFSALGEKMRRKAEEENRKRMETLGKFDFSLETIDGKTISRKEFSGQVLVVNVWGTWCGPCRAEIPHFVELQKRYHDRGLRIVGLNSEQTKDRNQATRLVRRFVEDHKINYPCALVPQEVLQKIPDFRAFPTTLVFGRDGSARGLQVGGLTLSQLEAIVKPLVSEAAPSPAPKE